jgi:RNA polymerase sigma-70 factor, ECF subfamily
VPDPDLNHWQPWLARHRAALFLMARQYLHTPQEAEDAMQEGFTHFWNARHTAQDPAAFLFTCVRNAALDQRRSTRSRRRFERHHAGPSLPLFHSPLEHSERRQQIEQALTHLPEDQREVLILKIWSDLTFAQIADTLDIPPNTAASRYRYALTHLETLLAKEFKNV